jgi:putative FmdB family regulatory protein
MPTYDYRCTACGARFEAWQKFTDEPIRVCPTCSGPAQRVIHAPAISFKGSGFYSTDSRAATKEAASPAPAETAPAASESASASDGAGAKPSDTPKPSTSTSERTPSASPTSAKPAAAPSTN